MAVVARPFAILALGGGIAEIGSAVAAQTIPTLVLLLLAGAMTDRLPRDRVLVWGNLVEATSEATFAGPGWALAAIAAAFTVAAVVRFGMRITPLHVPEKSMHVWRDLADGWREFCARQWLWVAVLQFSVVVAINTAVMSVLGPLTVARSLYGPQSWGLVLGATSLGAFVGAGAMMRWRPRRPMRTVTAVVFVAALPPLGLAVPVAVPALCVTTFVTGLGMTVFGVIWATTMQQRIPPGMLSRMFAYDAVGSAALAPVAAVLVGPAAGTLGTSTTLLFAAGLSAAATGAAFFSPQIRSGLPGRDSVC